MFSLLLLFYPGCGAGQPVTPNYSFQTDSEEPHWKSVSATLPSIVAPQPVTLPSPPLPLANAYASDLHAGRRDQGRLRLVGR